MLNEYYDIVAHVRANSFDSNLCEYGAVGCTTLRRTTLRLLSHFVEKAFCRSVISLNFHFVETGFRRILSTKYSMLCIC